MSKKNKKETYAADNVTLTNAPEDEEYTIRTNTSFINPLKTNQYYPGDSVDQHKELEENNRDIAREEIRQQNENNSL
ncbi:hypothetical protein QA612_10985 [Evansella sp. AB-P1]|uniref:hypothetical protein n=1 Tax=Evansella sp. AB-P1 TaxID=3037653 RepID=UPI00241EC515|nr:hypothetical protein [Evansella sp. AB-P1]MDG5788014.1 hypothetical protein [Evansella sp. AB-P1]